MSSAALGSSAPLTDDPAEVRIEMTELNEGTPAPKKKSFVEVARTAMIVRNWLMSVQDEAERHSDADNSIVFELPTMEDSTVEEMNESRERPINRLSQRVQIALLQERAPPITRTISSYEPSIVYEVEVSGIDITREKLKDLGSSLLFFYVRPTSKRYQLWTTLVFIGVLYNMFSCTIFIFDDVYHNGWWQWFTLNCVFDLIYFFDIVVQTRLTYLQDGSEVRNVKMLGLNYLSKNLKFLDVISLLPADFFLFLTPSTSLLRIPRLFRMYRVLDFVEQTQRSVPLPNFFKIAVLMVFCVVLFHWNACAYYFFSLLEIEDIETEGPDSFIFTYSKVFDPIIPKCKTVFEDIDDVERNCLFNETAKMAQMYGNMENLSDYTYSTHRYKYQEEMKMYWKIKGIYPSIFSNFSKEYSMCMYWSSLTVTTSGQQPWPSNSKQNMLEIVDTLIGLVVFATIVGSVGNVVSDMNTNLADFQETMDAIKFYMKNRAVVEAVQKRVVNYFHYMFQQHQMADERELLDTLPYRLQGQLAVNLHMDSVRRVDLFKDCEVSFLYEVVLRLRQQVYSPNDHLCQIGEKAKDMFIVKRGCVVILDEHEKPVGRVNEGECFGELFVIQSVVHLIGDRREQELRSVGYSDVYVLTREDVTDLLHDYPTVRDQLHAKALDTIPLPSHRSSMPMLHDEEEGELRADELVDFLSLEEQLHRLRDSIRAADEQLELLQQSFHRLSCDYKRRITNVERVYQGARTKIHKDCMLGVL